MEPVLGTPGFQDLARRPRLFLTRKEKESTIISRCLFQANNRIRWLFPSTQDNRLLHKQESPACPNNTFFEIQRPDGFSLFFPTVQIPFLPKHQTHFFPILSAKWAMNAAKRLVGQLQDQKDTEAPGSHQPEPGRCDDRDWASVPGTRPIKFPEGSLLTFPPGRGSRPPPPARRPGYPAAPPRWTAATSGTARSAGARPAGAGGSPLPSPGRPGCSWPSAWSWAPGPPRGPRTVPPESLREAGARARGRSLESPGRASRRPRNPEPIAGRSRVATQPRLAPPAEAGSAPRARRSGAAHARRYPPARRRRPDSPFAFLFASGAAACTARCGPLRPGAHS